MQTRCLKDFFLSPTDSVLVERHSLIVPYPAHAHEFGEIVIIEHGTALHVLNGRETVVSKGAVACIWPHGTHAFNEVDRLGVMNVHFRFTEQNHRLLQELFASPDTALDWHLGERGLAKVRTLIDALGEETQVPLPVSACYREGVFLQLLALLAQYRHCRDNQPSPEERFRLLVAFLRDNFAGPVDWQDLGDQFSLPMRTLSRKIKEKTGLTPQRYLNALRLDMAAKRLESSDASVTEIAFACGFEDSNYFSTVFRKEFGVSPRHFRTGEMVRVDRHRRSTGAPLSR